jgi:NADP-dependent 3-hydroxy acid dehydrogenase YdfG
MSEVGMRSPDNAFLASRIGRFDGQCAIVTGASRGIGYAIAALLAELGARVALVARSSEAIAAAAESAGPAAVGIACDVASDRGPAEIVGRALAGFARIDILIHCAGVITQDEVAKADLAALEQMFRVNSLAPYALTQAALPALKQTRGQVLFINSSILGAADLGGRGGYAATKYALKAVADSLRSEVNEHGVRVISIMPGTTATASQERLHAMAGKPYRPERLLQPVDVAMAVCDALAMPRTAEITDLYIRPMQKP